MAAMGAPGLLFGEFLVFGGDFGRFSGMEDLRAVHRHDGDRYAQQRHLDRLTHAVPGQEEASYGAVAIDKQTGLEYH